MNTTVSIQNASVVFGRNPDRALAAVDTGMDRQQLKQSSGQVLGAYDCSLDLQEGQTVVLMGLSGSGKSTLLRTVNGLAPLARGQVTVSTPRAQTRLADAGKATIRKLRLHDVSMVFQGFGLLPWRSVRENIGLGLELQGIPRQRRDERVAQELQLIGLQDWAERSLSELSGGMQQRVGLARAFVTDAPILLMDEPYSALDPLIRRKMQDELVAMQKRCKRSILFVSHDLDEAVKIGDRIAIMEGGRIIQIGTAREILAAPKNEYVADFVSHLDPMAVLLAEDIAITGDAEGVKIPRNTPLREVAAQLQQTESIGLQGGGRIDRATLLRYLGKT